jgi:tRNA (cytidine/uridine-2'-O-)-methyltransferase
MSLRSPQFPPLHLALFEPDIAQNAGTILRMCACFGIAAHIIEPAGFVSSDRTFRRAGMDYLDHVALMRHASWDAFQRWRSDAGPGKGRLLALSTKATVRYCDHAFAPGDVLLLGRESAGLPDHVHAAADARLRIPMRPPLRSLNVAISAAIVAAEALRQIGAFPSA